jgi:hypothetical protein
MMGKMPLVFRLPGFLLVALKRKGIGRNYGSLVLMAIGDF